MDKMVRIPRVDWHVALAKAISTAATGATIAVHTEEMKELAESAKKRMGRGDLKIVVEEPAEP